MFKMDKQGPVNHTHFDAVAMSALLTSHYIGVRLDKDVVEGDAIVLAVDASGVTVEAPGSVAKPTRRKLQHIEASHITYWYVGAVRKQDSPFLKGDVVRVAADEGLDVDPVLAGKTVIVVRVGRHNTYDVAMVDDPDQWVYTNLEVYHLEAL